MSTAATPGTVRWARSVFADELARLQVRCDERAYLDGALDELAGRLCVSRRSFVQTYLTEATIRMVAQRTAATVTGADPNFLAATTEVEKAHPEAAGWPQEVRNYLIDHRSSRTGVARYGEVLIAGKLGIEELGLFRLRYADTAGLAKQLGYGVDATVPIVTFQHPDLLRDRQPLRADPSWGRPVFEWAYRLMHATYRRKTGLEAERLLWGWADLVTCVAGHRPDLAVTGALDRIAAACAGPGAIAVVARVPVERCMFTSHLLFDGLMLRGRYIPESIGDALRTQHRFGRCHLDTDDPADPIRDVVIDSWMQRLVETGTDWRDVRLQVCIDRIEPHEIVSVRPVSALGAAAVDASGPPGIDPQRLID